MHQIALIPKCNKKFHCTRCSAAVPGMHQQYIALQCLKFPCVYPLDCFGSVCTIQHCHVYKTTVFTCTAILNVCQRRDDFSYFYFSFTNAEFLEYCSVLSWERANEKVVIQNNFQSVLVQHYLCIDIYLISFYRILQNATYPPQKALTFASYSIERSRMIFWWQQKIGKPVIYVWSLRINIKLMCIFEYSPGVTKPHYNPAWHPFSFYVH